MSFRTTENGRAKSRYHHESAVQLRRRRKILYGNVRADHLRAAESILFEYHDFSDNSNTPVGHEHDTDQRLFDGLIFLGILDKGVREQIAQIDLPKVYVDIYDRTHKSDSVITENIYSSYELTNYLIQQGHTDIGFVGTVGSTTSISDRYLGYLRRMLEEGISPKNEWRIPDRSEEGIAIPLLLPEKLPTAFVCNCDATAFKLVQALKERGICVPEDVSVTGFDDSIYAQLCSPSLTTVAVDTDAIARLAAKRMIKHMNEPQKKSGEVYRIPGKIIYRDSVCKINGSSDKRAIGRRRKKS